MEGGEGEEDQELEGNELGTRIVYISVTELMLLA